MATMIPPIIPHDTPSGGEMEVFRRLRDDPGTERWIVLHSFGLAEHVEQVQGEIDFVVIIPGKGVLCLEIKGCSAAHLRRDARGLWHYGNKDKGDPRGPFRQASEGMHSLRHQVIATRPDLSHVQFSSGVIFPFAPFRVRSVEWHDWEVIDSQLFRSAPISRLLRQMMEESRAHILAKPTPPRLAPDSPTPEQCLIIRDVLRGQFELPIDRRARSDQLERELLRYTTEQFVALDAMEANPRTIFAGPAGVGKTLLAMEAARRAKTAGRRVLLVCFNHPLGTWLGRQMADARPEVTTRTLHGHMLAISGVGRAPDNAGPDFWRTVLPIAAIDRLLEGCGEDDQRVFDELVVDEAQDILRDSYLDFLDLSLRGGLAGGRWRIFGDFENQAIYDAATLPLEGFRSARAPGAPLFSLRVNCRNTPLVAEWVRVLAGLDPGYHRVLRPDDGVSPVFLFYEDEPGRQERLVEALVTLEAQGFRGQDVVVLSPRADRSSTAASVNVQPWRDRLRPLSQAKGGQIAYGTIQAFKGLEAPAVVVTDVETISQPLDRALLYVATTRPLQRLTIIAHSRVRDEAIRLISSPASVTSEDR